MHPLDDLADLLPPFLLQQRWFGGKARRVTSCQIEDVADLHAGTAVVVARVAYDEGRPERYALLVMHQREEHPLPAIGRLERAGTWAFESAAHASTVRALLGGFERGTLPTSRGGRLEYADLSDSARAALGDPETPIKVLGAEQSNTSIRIGTGLVFKLFRRLEVGENPEVEIGRFLSTRTSFRETPRLHGSLSYVAPTGERSTLGVMQAWVDNLGDGWSYVLKQLGDCSQAAADPGALERDLGQLGQVTARFHAAVASDPTVPDFAPEPLGARDADDWKAQVLHEADETFTLLRRQVETWSGDNRALGQQVLALSAGARDVVGAVGGASGTFHKIRIHGDYHLGQTLKTAAGFIMIDFEGEPARPLAVRRSKQCGLKDVAGMLRSVDYAVDTACAGQLAPPEAQRLGAALRRAFVDRYVETALESRAVSVPADRAEMQRWIVFFEFEKALYELRYEIQNRPGWVGIPLRALQRALDRPDDRGATTRAR